MPSLDEHRSFFANLVTAAANVRVAALTEAFRSTLREQFLGGGPWRVFTPAGYIETPSDDPAFVYQDIVVALTKDGAVNNGQPSLHAACLAALDLKPGELVVHVGAGTGYYTAIMAKLIGPSGTVFAYERDEALASRAAASLAELPQVSVFCRSGSEGSLPNCDAIYVNAGATSPLDLWLDALRPGGRLLFPLTPAEGVGGMLLVNSQPSGATEARFICEAMFIPCTGARDTESARLLTEAFQRSSLWRVRSLHRRTPPDETCWYAGSHWWLSTSGPTQLNGTTHMNPFLTELK